jgi:hypothetical protein
MKLVVLVLAVAFVGAAIVLPACGTSCVAKCRETTMVIASRAYGGADNLDDLTAITLEGNACPAEPPACRRDVIGSEGHCVEFMIAPRHAGTCRATLTFSKRPAFVAETTFGDYVDDDCCAGFPATSKASFFVPTPNQDAGTGSDGDAP